MEFIDLKEAHDKDYKEVPQRWLESIDVLVVYIRVINDMYDGIKTSVIMNK